eukprot:gb/GFBE01081562.1/.p1 GENE.gb/GFBE01081562.1/~~gb/GFBE01081562.1/.p1  ORF type:complete len:316 (+),score=49.38 gb/GFBE01081562.1/:1-948(+)
MHRGPVALLLWQLFLGLFLGLVVGTADGGEPVFGEEGDFEDPCKCAHRGCPCDLSTFASIGGLMQELGYDRCVEDGPCEECSEPERPAVHCAASSHRQKVVCVRCLSASPQLPYCTSGYRIFWSQNRSGAANETERMRGSGASLFFRSCGTPRAPAKASHALLLRSPPAARSLPPRRNDGDGEEGSAEVMYFLFANAAVLAMSAWALWRQQQKRWEQTMKGLYACVEDGRPSAARASDTSGSNALLSAGAPGVSSPPRWETKSKASDWRNAGSSSDPSPVVPDSIGRSIESLAGAVGAVARSGSSMMGEGRTKMK